MKPDNSATNARGHQHGSRDERSFNDSETNRDSRAGTGSSDGVANVVKGSGSNNGGTGGPENQNGRRSDTSRSTSGTQGGGENRTGQRTPSDNGPHGAHTTESRGSGGGNGGREGSMSGSSRSSNS